MQLLSTLLALFPTILTIISFAFTTLTTVSKDWSHQNHYSSTSHTLWTPANTIYTTYRSPFHACSPTLFINGTLITTLDPNFAANLANGVVSTLALLNTTYNHLTVADGCTRYAPYGHAKTSCTTDAEAGMNLDDDPRQGDDRMCQQVHMAGSLSIAASVFSGLALLTTLGLTAVALTSSSSSTNTAKSALTLVSIAFLALSGILLFLAQEYGVLGLVQSQVPNGLFASSVVPSNGAAGGVTAGPWEQGKASVVYGCVGWFAALLAVGVLVAGESMVGSGKSGANDGAVDEGERNNGAVGERGLWSRRKREKGV